MPKITSINLRRGTTTSWTTPNPVLADGEIAWDSTVAKFKIGNGTGVWTALPYVGDAALAGKANSSHTHDATHINAGTLPDARLPARLNAVASTITDWNLAVTNGWYMGYNILNQPVAGTTWYLGQVDAHNNLYVTQTAVAFTGASSANTQTFRRHNMNGTWGAWYKLQLSQAEQDARYLQVSQRAAVNGVASLDANGKVPASQLPAAQVGTSLMGTYAQRPTASSTAAGTIYYATDTMESYRCNGTSWDVIAAGSELGSAELRSFYQTANGGGVWTDLPGMAVTFVAGERPIKVELTLDFCVTVGNTNAQARLLINNTVSMSEISAWQPYSHKWDTRGTKVRWYGLVTGNIHTIKTQVKADTGAEIWVDGSSTKTSLLTVSGV